jgi:hypothetical protein
MNNRTTKTVTHAASLFVAPVLLCGLSLAQDVVYNALPGTDFSAYHTYQWASCGNSHPNGITDTEIKNDINSALSAKGFMMVAPETKSDLLVCYQVGIQQQTQWNAFGMGRFAGMGQATSSTINNGTLVFDVYTMANKQQIWQGRATKTISPSGNEEKNLKNLQNGINKLLKNFPPIQKG